MTDANRLIDLDAEKAVIGSCLIDPDAVMHLDGLTASDFHDERHQSIYQAIIDLTEEQTPPDVITVAARSKADRGYLTGLLGHVPSALEAGRYGRIVNRLGTLRRLMGAAAKITAMAYSSDSEALDEVFAKARQMVDSIAPAGLDDAVLLWLDSIDAFFTNQLGRLGEVDAVEKGESKPPLVLPWRALAPYSLRLRPGTLMIVAAGSGVGKTMFLENASEYWAKTGYRVAFYHLELSHQLMLDRRMARVSGVPIAEIEAGEMTAAMDQASAAMRNYPGGITYIHCPGWSAARIAQQARQLWTRGLCDVVVVDYLQKLRLGYIQGQNKSDALGHVAEVFKIAAEKLGLPVVLASQFNRGAEFASRKSGAFIRGSGEPHEKANIVLTLDRPILDQDAKNEYGKPVAMAGERSPVVQVRVDKNTMGPTGETKLVMSAAQFRILDEAQQKEAL